jgi:hypothetical protein
MQQETEKTTPAWILSLSPVVSADNAFSEWCYHHISNVVRTATTAGLATASNNAATQGTAQLEASMARMAAVVEKLALGTSAAAQAAQAKETAVTMYTNYQVAAIKGFCGLRDTNAIPVIWARFQTSKHTDDHRLNVDKRMKEWSTQRGIEIDQGVFFSKETIDDIVKLRPNPGDGHPTLKTGEKGISILVCLPRTQQEIEAIRLREQAADDSRQNRTLAEALKLAATESRQPAANCLELKLNIATYLAKLWALFGEKCHLYQKGFQIYQLFRQPTVMAAKFAFTPLLCRQITWAIYEDSRQFFSTRLHPDDFNPGTPTPFPISLLDDVLGDIRYQRPILQSSFPLAWQDVPLPSGLAQVPPLGPSPFLGQRPAESAKAQYPMDKLAHVHPTIRAALRDYHAKFAGRVMIQRMLDHANITFRDLPFLHPLIDQATGKNWLCYNHCLGICQHGKQ